MRQIHQGRNIRLIPPDDADVRFWLVQQQIGNEWFAEIHSGTTSGKSSWHPKRRRFPAPLAVSAVNRAGRTSAPVILRLRR